MDSLLDHIKDVHKLDFANYIRNLNFYQRIKLVNYIRRQVLNSHCIYCDEVCEDNSKLLVHIKEKNHNKLPGVEIFDQPEYDFPYNML